MTASHGEESKKPEQTIWADGVPHASPEFQVKLDKAYKRLEHIFEAGTRLLAEKPSTGRKRSRSRPT